MLYPLSYEGGSCPDEQDGIANLSDGWRDRPDGEGWLCPLADLERAEPVAADHEGDGDDQQ